MANLIEIQAVRSSQSIEKATQICKEQAEEIKQLIVSSNIFPEPFISIAKNKCNDLSFIKSVLFNDLRDFQKTQKFANMLAERTWVIYYNPQRNYLAKTNMPFFISDNPVLFYNTYVGLVNIYDIGLNNPYTSIYYPMSPDILIEILPIIHKTKAGTLYRGLKSIDSKKKEISPQNPVIMFANKSQFENCKQQVFVPTYYSSFLDREAFNIKNQ